MTEGSPQFPLLIGEASTLTGLNVHTLRYYERVGLVPPVTRNAAGHRTYTEQDLRWLGLADRLRTSGMWIRSVKEYAAMVREGDRTLPRRREFLREHAKQTRARINELRESLAIIRAKLALYDGRLDDPDAVWKLLAAAQNKRRVTS